MALLGSGLQYLYAPNLPLQFPANPAAAAAAVISLAPSPVGINQLLTVPVPFPGFHLLTSSAPPQSACIPRNPSMPILPIDSARSMTSPQMCCVEAFDTNMINCRSPDVCSKPALDNEPSNHRQLIDSDHPETWTNSEVLDWLSWCGREFSFEELSLSRFNMNGKALCLLTKEAFFTRSPEYGDILYDLLQATIKKCELLSPSKGFDESAVQTGGHSDLCDEGQNPSQLKGNHHLHKQNVIKIGSSPHTMFSPPPLLLVKNIEHNQKGLSELKTWPVNKFPLNLPAVKTIPCNQISVSPPTPPLTSSPPPTNHHLTIYPNEPSTGPRLLWSFLYQLLREGSGLVRWVDEAQGVFQILQPQRVALKWGGMKNRHNMTYEKMSRALRYYYKMNIIHKEPGRKLTYRFLGNPEMMERSLKASGRRYKVNGNNNNNHNQNIISTNGNHGNQQHTLPMVSSPCAFTSPSSSLLSKRCSTCDDESDLSVSSRSDYNMETSTEAINSNGEKNFAESDIMISETEINSSSERKVRGQKLNSMTSNLLKTG